MNYLNKIKEHWLISTIILCGAVFVMIWSLPANLMVEPRNSEIENLPSQPTSIVKTEDKPDYEKKSLNYLLAFFIESGNFSRLLNG